MTKYKKPDQPGPGTQEQAERLARSLGDSAHQIWLAGVGAFGRAQVEGTRLFENLVQEGSSMENNARRFADRQAESARTSIESNLESARHQATDTWTRLEKTFEDRVHRTMVRFGVPAREDLAELSRRVDALTAELRKRDTAGAPRKTAASPRAAPARKATRSATAKSPTRKTSAKKSVRPTGASGASGPATRR